MASDELLAVRDQLAVKAEKGDRRAAELDMKVLGILEELAAYEMELTLENP